MDYAIPTLQLQLLDTGNEDNEKYLQDDNYNIEKVFISFIIHSLQFKPF